MSTRVVNRKYEQYDVYIGRGSPWGNPYFIGPGMTRAQAIRAYRTWLAIHPELVARISELKGRRLGCYCAPKLCHGDVLARLADGELATLRCDDTCQATMDRAGGDVYCSCGAKYYDHPYCRGSKFDEHSYSLQVLCDGRHVHL